MADSVAEKSGFLCMYMSNHPDTLVAYAKWFGKVKEVITSAEMTGIDSKGMSLKCTFKDGQKKDVRVPIDPPLLGYEEVKPRLLEMKAWAQEGLGMIKAPVISELYLTKAAYWTGIPVLLLFYVWLAHGQGWAISGPADYLVSWTGFGVIRWPALITFVLHVLEAIYTFSLCYRHSTGFRLGLAYVVATIFSGIHVWKNLRRKIQAARIDSVMKIQ